jgi:hypothetical protein
VDARSSADLLGVKLVAGTDLDTQVVERVALPRLLEQHELQRRAGGRGVRVAGAGPGGLDAEQPAGEGGGGLDVVDAESQVDAGHGDDLPVVGTDTNPSMLVDA